MRLSSGAVVVRVGVSAHLPLPEWACMLGHAVHGGGLYPVPEVSAARWHPLLIPWQAAPGRACRMCLGG